jgi:hypothetical protein
MLTPAQASGHPDFVTDVATQGPTDPGQREAACRWAQTLPTRPGCVDCTGPLPPWLRAPSGVLGERVMLGGREICCFD